MRTNSSPCFARLCVVGLAAALLTAGCSTEAWYEGMKRRAQLECDHRPYGERADCRARVREQPYGEYEKARSAHTP